MDNLIFPEKTDDWQILLTFLPVGWQSKARELGAIQRYRNFENPETLLRILFIHLADGCSLRETATGVDLAILPRLAMLPC